MANVTSDGTVSGVGEGETKIRARASDLEAEVDVRVTGVPVRSLVVTAPDSRVNVGGRLQLTATATYEDDSTLNVTSDVGWSVSNDKGLTVLGDGEVTGLVSGNQTVTATIGGVSAAFDIQVLPLASVWTDRAVIPAINPFARFINDRFIVGGQNDWIGLHGNTTLGVSVDGRAWQISAPEGLTDVQDVAYGNGVYVMTTNFSYTFTSPDLKTFTKHDSTGIPPDGNYLYRRAVVFGNGTFVTTRQRSLYSSTDGITWTERVTRPGFIRGLIFVNGRFVAADGGGDSFYWMTSDDGVSWTTHESTEFGNPDPKLAYGNGILLAQARAYNSGNRLPISLSTDLGESWTYFPSSGRAKSSDTIFGLGAFLTARGAVSGGTEFLTSVDGQNWQSAALAKPGRGSYNLATDGKVYVAAGSDAGKKATIQSSP